MIFSLVWSTFWITLHIWYEFILLKAVISCSLCFLGNYSNLYWLSGFKLDSFFLLKLAAIMTYCCFYLLIGLVIDSRIDCASGRKPGNTSWSNNGSKQQSINDSAILIPHSLIDCLYLGTDKPLTKPTLCFKHYSIWLFSCTLIGFRSILNLVILLFFCSACTTILAPSS